MNQPASNIKPWFVCPKPNPNTEIRIFLFPFAGGGPSLFGKWFVKSPCNIVAWAAHYPGRGSRYTEPAVKQLAVLVENLFHAIQPHLDKPFAFFGHSMGGLVAFELIRQLRQNDLPQPIILFVSACGAPHLPDPHPPIHALTDAKFLKGVEELNGIPSEVLNIPDLMELFLPALRADFEAFEAYYYVPEDHPFNFPIIAFGGVDDPRVSRERLEGWASYTNSRFISRYFSGGHFFIDTSKEAIISSIIAEITSTHAKG